MRYAVGQHESQCSGTGVRPLVATLLVATSLAVAMAANAREDRNSTPDAGKHNLLSAAEKAAGWKLLFDGETSSGWRGFHKSRFPAGSWSIEDGCIKRRATAGRQSQDGGDIITVDQFENFELRLEWKISPGGNSGIKYLVNESLPPTGASGIGPEMQILDDDRHPDAKMGRDGNRTAGSLYDLIAPQGKLLQPVGDFNQVRLRVNGPHVEHWLNARKIVEYDLDSVRFREVIALSKFRDIPGFAQSHRGHILLQDHGDEVWFRDIKILELKDKT
ncbi:MAG TPA: DUF1080 domain-containing protein [Blastocatellia bacterium]|nr:DUF1080 domain-containing protein [Blastocatellia bacterium]